ncbi:MAG: hypothetical protein H6722_08340 [Sandaracinus sp.]|nr:hypothetical protein [Myxococcales bacterium]MCB9612445.1 hypothetical protein [Sandaracinus sp.]
MRTSKLFHAIVVVGASLTACGGDDDAVVDAGQDAGLDAGALADAGSVMDAGHDSGAAIDAALGDDAGPDDAGEDAFVAIL